METFNFDRKDLVAVALVAAITGWIYTILSNPLAKVPGTWHSLWTDAAIKYTGLTGTKPKYIHELHQKYGPVVRIAPREASIQDPSGPQQIYRVKGEFRKTEFYKSVVLGGESVFSTIDVAHHRRLRRLLSNGISESGLMVHRPVIDGKIRLAIQRMSEELETRGATDVFNWYLCMATDVIGELSFGESFRMLETGEVNDYMGDLRYVARAAGIRTSFPTLAWLSQFVPIPFLQKALALNEKIRTYADESLKRHYKLVEEQGEAAKPTLLSKLYKAEEGGLSHKDLRNNAASYIVAGTDTTANTLTYLTWLVCTHPEVKARLIKELQTLPEDFNYDQVKVLPYLNLIIEETLRLYSAAPVGLPREVPQGGADFLGYHIPAGYTVSAQAYSMHKIEAVFPDPYKFDPMRWENPTQAMKDSFVPWGGGSRTCIGLHLARMELRLMTARFFLTFPNAKISSKEGFSDEEMEPTLFAIQSPKGQRCLIEVS